MANIHTCDHAYPRRCKVMGKVGKDGALRRVSVMVYTTTTTETNPFSCCTVLRDLCPKHADEAQAWADRFSRQADFSDLDASGADSMPDPQDEPS